MGLKDILSKLDKVMDTKKGRAAKQIKAIEELIIKLQEKEIKYKAKLKLAKDSHAKKKLVRKIKVCKAQVAKGEAAAEALRTR